MNHKLTIRNQSGQQEVEILDGTTILKAIEKAGISIQAPCGGNGICGKCQVRLISGTVDPAEVQDDFVLACQTKINGDLIIEIPEKNIQHKLKILERGIQRAIELRPVIKKLYFELHPPSLEDQRADLERILEAFQAVHDTEISFSNEILSGIMSTIRALDYKITLVIHQNQIIAIEPGDTCRFLCGVAFDIGTTTVAGLLVDLVTGEILASASRTNPQIAHGDDVVSRIDYSEKPQGLEKLSTEIRECLNSIIQEVCSKTQVNFLNIYEIAIAGNTTMTHLFHGIPPGNIARAPYVPVFSRAILRSARQVELSINPQGVVYTLPNIAGFVGADTSAAILAAGMHVSEKVLLLIDIGTNGEIALGNKEKILVCSTAAGPAFEGARLTFGMRAMNGAIEKVEINENLNLGVIGNQKARGICGSGVIDLLAELLKVGLIDATGQLVMPENSNPILSDQIKNRIHAGEKGNQFILSDPSANEAIYLSQRDIREIQLAKAAIWAGFNVLLQLFPLAIEKLDTVLLAGAFGNYIRRQQARQIGLLPNLPDEKIHFIGNAAIEGALRVLLSEDERLTLERIARQVQYVELSGRLDFQENYVEGMMFEKND
ncbi:DUF4445 domain-containing protein [candidate division KSB1 bacterium]|nr:DUF4445 domain-containing protein [candidate division KSB1 bacterium]